MAGPAEKERSGEGARTSADDVPFAGTINLMAHPMAAFAAMSAIGLGFASQAFGMWAGALAASAEAQRRSAEGVKDFTRPEAEAYVPARSRPELVSSNDLPRRAPAKRGERKDALAPQRKMAETAPAAAARQDDLKTISGIGPKLEKILNGLGITTYRQVAELTDEQIAKLDSELGIAGRIQRDGWIDQAQRLV